MLNCFFLQTDGEAETGPLAATWNSYKFIDPKVDGAVLPILHLNGWKISSPSIYGTMRSFFQQH
jgi:xylulose-5-phosphate/fructose-6-phosphate phosphoketolase